MMKQLFTIIITISSVSFAGAQSYLPTAGGTMTGNLYMSSSTQIQTPYLGFNYGNTSPAHSGNVAIFTNSTTSTLDFVGWSNGWNFIPVSQAPYPGPVVSIDNNGNILTKGNIGIGTTTPISKLHISGDNYLTIGDYSNSNGIKGIQFTGWRDILPNYFGASIDAIPSWMCCGSYLGIKDISLNFNVHNNPDSANSKLTAMTIIPGGNVGIGITNPQQKLAVNGIIQAKEINVTTTGWPDYVFTPEHQLPSLQTLATQIKEQGHLPNIPSAEEVSKNGIALGEMNKKLLEKVEELTLYAIEQDAESKKLKAESVQQKALLQTQSEDMKQLKEFLEKQNRLLEKQNTELLKRIEKLENKK